MQQSSAAFGPSRRRFLRSGISLVGLGLALTSASLLAGCGGSDKEEGQIENPVDPTKTPSGIDSMKGYMQEKKQRQGGTTKR